MDTDLDQHLASVKIARLYRMISRSLDNHLQPLGLRRGQHAMLLAVADLASPSMTELAHRLDTDKAAVTRSVSSCRDKGWVTIRTSSDNQKNRYAVLTPDGEALVADIRAAMVQVEQRLEAAISPALYQLLKEETQA